MKKVAILFACLLIASGSFAQIEKGAIAVGGNFGFTSVNESDPDAKNTSVVVNPKIGLAVTDKTVVSAIIGLSTGNRESTNFVRKSRSFGLGAEAKQYIPVTPMLNLFGLGQVLFTNISSEETSFNVDFEDAEKVLNIGLSGGAEWFPTNFVSFHVQVGIIGFVSISDDNSDYRRTEITVVDFQNGDLFGNAGFTFWFK